jgi:hypothetical protein
MSEKSSSSNIAALELETITNFQYALHLSTEAARIYDNPGYQPSEDSGIIDSFDNPESNFYNNQKKSGWSVSARENALGTLRGNDIIEFVANNGLDHLRHSYLVKKFPKIKVSIKLRGKVQICWCHNLGHNAYDSIQLWFDNNVGQTITPIWLDIYQQKLLKPELRELYAKMVGDKIFVGNWGHETIDYTTKTPLAFYYDKNNTQAVPLFTQSGNSTTRHIIKYKTKISDFIKMRRLNDGKWEEIQFNWKFIEGASKSKKDGNMDYGDRSDPPELWHYYSKFTDNEKRWFKEHKMVKIIKNITQNIPLTYYTEDIIVLPVKKCKAGSNIDINISSTLPVNAIYWVAQNADGLIYKNYSNYTTNPFNSDDGENPMKDFSMGYNVNEKKINNMDAFHVDEMSSYYDNITGSTDPGYNCLSLCYDLKPSNVSKIGLTFSKYNTTMNINLKNMEYNADNSDDDDDDEDLTKALEKMGNKNEIKKEVGKPEYNIHVILYVTKRIDFYNGDLNIPEKVVIHDGNKPIKY